MHVVATVCRTRVVTSIATLCLVVGCFGLTSLSRPYFFCWVGLVLSGTFLLSAPLLSDSTSSPEAEHKYDLPLVFAISIFGAAFRLLFIGDFPPQDGALLTDEAISGLQGWKVIHEDYWSLYAPVFTMAYPVALSFALFGYSIETLRLPYIIAGVVTLPLLFPFARIFFDRKVAFVALFLFSVSRWHNMVGRVAIDWVHVPLLCILCYHCFWRGLLTNWRYFILNALFVGIALLSYYSLRIIVLVELVSLSWYLIQTPLPIKKRIVSFASFLGSVVLFALPSRAAFAADQSLQAHISGKYQHLFEKSFSELISYLVSRSTTVARSFWDLDQSLLINTNRLSFVDPVTIAFFILGLLLIVPKMAKDARYGFLWIWLSATVLPGGLLVDIYYNHRLIGLLPLMCMLAAYAIVRSTEFFAGLSRVVLYRKIILSFLIIGVCASCALINFRRFFVALDPQIIESEYRAWRPALCSAMRDSGAYVFDMSGYGCIRGDWRWLTFPAKGIETLDYLEALPPTIPAQNIYFALTSDGFGKIPFDHWRKRLAFVYPAPVVIVDSNVDFQRDQQAIAFVPIEIVAARRQFKQDSSSKWRGSFFVSRTADYLLEYQTPGTLLIDGKEALPNQSSRLIEGWHSLISTAATSPMQSLLLNREKLKSEHVFDADVSSTVHQSLFAGAQLSREKMVPNFFGIVDPSGISRIVVTGRSGEGCTNCRLRLEATGLAGKVSIDSQVVAESASGGISAPVTFSVGAAITLSFSVTEPGTLATYQLLISEGASGWRSLEPASASTEAP